MPLGPLIARGRTAEVYAWRDGRVIKLFYEGARPGAIERELATARAVAVAGVAAPAAFGIEMDGSRTGIVYEAVSGDSMLSVMSARPWRLRGFARQLASLHLQLHAATVDGPERQRDRLARRIGQGEGLTDKERSSVLSILDRLPDGGRLCHGDFHPGNVILSPAGPVVIDWMDATVGNPLADVARSSVLHRFGPLSERGRVRRLLLRKFSAAFDRAYVGRYIAFAGTDREAASREIAEWRVVVAAARLDERVREEHSALLRFVRSRVHT